MRDVGLFIWVAIVLIGVASSIVSSAGKRRTSPQAGGTVAGAAARRGVRTTDSLPAQRTPALTEVSIQRPVPPPPLPAPPRATASAVLHAPVQTAASRGRGLLRDRTSLVRAIVAAEVLKKPGGLSDEY